MDYTYGTRADYEAGEHAQPVLSSRYGRTHGPAKVSATDHDLQEFRRILTEQRRVGLDQWRSAPLRTTFVLINRVLGDPARILFAVTQALLGTYRSGTAISSRYGVSLATQFFQIFAEAMRSKLWFKGYYLYQLYLPSRWRNRKRQFPLLSEYLPAQKHLMERDGAPDFELLQNKHLFAHRCQEAGLPCILSLAEFVDGQPVEGITALPPKDLILKPSNDWTGRGVESWQYAAACDCFSNAVTSQKLCPSDLFQYLCDLSYSRRILVQERLRNHEQLLPLTNSALSTLRIVTCRCPSGSVDLMPPVLRMPAGHNVADNFARGGVAAPIDVITGVISGPALQKDDRLGVIRMEKHPDTDYALRGFRIPMWTEAVDLAFRAHQAFPSVHFVGWDIGILQDGPVLVEGNAEFDTDLTVLPHGISLSDTQFIPYYNHHWRNTMRCGEQYGLMRKGSSG